MDDIVEPLPESQNQQHEEALGEEVLPHEVHNVRALGDATTVTEVGSGSRPPRVGSGRRKYRSQVVLARKNTRAPIRGRGRGAGSVRAETTEQCHSREHDITEEERRGSIVERGTQGEGSIRTRSAMQRHRQRAATEGPPPQGNDGEDVFADDESFEEESERRQESVRVSNITKPVVIFPTETQYKDGYIWGYDTMFNANIDSIQNVVNAETNHRVLMDWRVDEMYERLKGYEADGVSAITLRPIAYTYESMNEKGETELVEVSFSHEGAAREFKFAFTNHNPENPSIPIDTVRTRWLQRNIVWEPVDGQHIVAACKRAQKENEEGKMSDEEYKKHFVRRKAKFVVYDNPQFYIEASVRINAKEFDRKFFTTFYENIVKLCDIWKACGSPSAASRIDDAYRAKALTMAASALHWSKGLPKNMSLANLSRKMLDYTRHAWNEDEESYKAILKVCRDYEEGKLFFSKKAEDKWKKIAREKNLDVTVDGNPTRERMERTWLRPLTKVSKETYLRVVKRMVAKEVVEGKRDRQEYYFNSATSSNPPEGTVAYVVDRLQRKDAVRNQIRYLMVQEGDENPLSMSDFYAIDASKYGGDRGRQFTLLGKTFSNDTKTLWSSPTVKTVQSLNSIGKHISPFVRQHFIDVKAGRRGYTGYGRDVEDVANARWDWQVALSTMHHQERPTVIHVRCKGGFFEDVYVELGKPCLWVFDCRRGASEGVDEEWSNEDYNKVLQQLQKWMSSILRWTAIFLFPPGVHFDEAMQSKMAVPESLHCLRGSWIFKPQTVSSYVHDLRCGEQHLCSVQAVGDIAIIMQYPRDSRPMENLPKHTNSVDVVFKDTWNEEVMPRVADKLERTPMELKRMIHMYLPQNWGLVTLGITMAVPEIIETGFVGDEVIIMEGGTARTEFVHNALQVMYGDKMVMVNSVSTTAERRSSQVLETKDRSPSRGSSETNANVPHGKVVRVARLSKDSSDVEERLEVIRRGKRKRQENAIDSGASSSSNSGSHTDQAHSDDLPSRGRSLGSVDTDAISDAHGDQVDLLEVEADPNYVPTENINDMENEESQGDMEEIEDTLATTPHDTDVVSDTHVDQTDLMEVEANPTYGPIGNTNDVENFESQDIHTDVGDIEGTPPTVLPNIDVVSDAHKDKANLLEVEAALAYVPTENTNDVENEEMQAPNTVVGEREGTPTITPSMSTMSSYDFLNSMSLFPNEDGYFYDREHVRYVQLGIQEPYTYERVTSILEVSTISPTLSEGVSTPLTSAMVDRALEYASPPPLSPIGELSINEEIEVVGRGEEEILTQSSTRVLETQDEAM